MSVRLQCVCAHARVYVFVRVVAMEKGVGGGDVGDGVAENWCYQYLTNPPSIFMADNRADQQLSHVSGSVFITRPKSRL